MYRIKLLEGFLLIPEPYYINIYSDLRISMDSREASLSTFSVALIAGLKPDKLDCSPSSPDASRTFNKWKTVFTLYKDAITQHDTPDGICTGLLMNCLSLENYDLVAASSSYEDALRKLSETFTQTPNEVISRHTLITRRQLPNESVDDYCRSLQRLAQDCEFSAVTAEQHKDLYIRDAFIAGLLSSPARTRLLESRSLSLSAALDQAKALELARRDARLYESNARYPTPTRINAVSEDVEVEPTSAACHRCSKTRFTLKEGPGPASDAALRPQLRKAHSEYEPNSKCYFCGSFRRHPRSKCRARNATCNNCHKRGHFANVCQSAKTANVDFDYPPSEASQDNNLDHTPVLAAMSPVLRKSSVSLKLDGITERALLDSGSSANFVSSTLVRKRRLTTHPHVGNVKMASEGLLSRITERCTLDVELNGEKYKGVTFLVLPQGCADVILGIDFLA